MQTKNASIGKQYWIYFSVAPGILNATLILGCDTAIHIDAASKYELVSSENVV